MSACLMCGVRAGDARDSTGPTGCTTPPAAAVRRGALRRSAGCCAWTRSPRPKSCGRYYPDNYWFAPDESAASRLEEAYRRLVLRDHVQFVTQALAGSTARGPLLDVGCGGGLFLGMMRERGFRVVGLDFSREAARHRLAAATGAGGGRATCERAPLRAGELRGRHHVPRDGAPLRSARLSGGGARTARAGRPPGGAGAERRVVAVAPAGQRVERRGCAAAPVRLSAIATWRSCWRAAGFEVLRRNYFSLRDNPAGLASSLAPSLDPMARRVRRVAESGGARLAKDLPYLALVVAALPFAVAEAAAAPAPRDDRGAPPMNYGEASTQRRSEEAPPDCDGRPARPVLLYRSAMSYTGSPTGCRAAAPPHSAFRDGD